MLDFPMNDVTAALQKGRNPVRRHATGRRDSRGGTRDRAANTCLHGRGGAETPTRVWHRTARGGRRCTESPGRRGERGAMTFFSTASSHDERRQREELPTPEPNDGRAVRFTWAPRGKVLVLLSERRCPLEQHIPNLRVIRIAQPNVDKVISLVAGRREHDLEAGRKLGVDQDLQRSAATRTAWSASAAAKARQARMSSFSR